MLLTAGGARAAALALVSTRSGGTFNRRGGGVSAESIPMGGSDFRLRAAAAAGARAGAPADGGGPGGGGRTFASLPGHGSLRGGSGRTGILIRMRLDNDEDAAMPNNCLHCHKFCLSKIMRSSFTQGYLLKKDDRTQGWLLKPQWHKRWFVLEGSVLRYYKTDQAARKDPQKWTVSFDLSVEGFDYAALFPEDPEASKRKYTVQLTIPVLGIATPDNAREWKGGGVGAVRNLVLGAATQAERGEWTNLFQYIRVESRLRASQAQHGSERMLAESMAQDDFMAITGALQLERRRQHAAPPSVAPAPSFASATTLFGGMLASVAPRADSPSDDGALRSSSSGDVGAMALQHSADAAPHRGVARPAPLTLRYKPDESLPDVRELRVALRSAMTADGLVREYARAVGGDVDLESRFVTFRGNRLPAGAALVEMGVRPGDEGACRASTRRCLFDPRVARQPRPAWFSACARVRACARVVHALCLLRAVASLWCRCIATAGCSAHRQRTAVFLSPHSLSLDPPVSSALAVWVRKVRSAATKPRTVREHAVADDYRRAHSAYRTLRERARRAVAERKRLNADHAALIAKVRCSFLCLLSRFCFVAHLFFCFCSFPCFRSTACATSSRRCVPPPPSFLGTVPFFFVRSLSHRGPTPSFSATACIDRPSAFFVFSISLLFVCFSSTAREAISPGAAQAARLGGIGGRREARGGAKRGEHGADSIAARPGVRGSAPPLAEVGCARGEQSRPRRESGGAREGPQEAGRTTAEAE